MAKQKICGVYKITNDKDGKFYIGSSKDIEQRWYEHKYELKNHKHGNKYLQNAWDKYGEDSFSFEVVEECDQKIQFEREQHYLNILNPFEESGYNLVRKISDGFFSQNYKKSICECCGEDFFTFSHLAKICDDCKSKRASKYRGEYEFRREEKEWFEELVTDAYGSYDDFWDSVI